MPVHYEDARAVFHGNVGVEEADALLAWLDGRAGACIDLAECVHLHAAPLQVLMAAHARVLHWPVEAGLKSWIEPVLTQD